MGRSLISRFFKIFPLLLFVSLKQDGELGLCLKSICLNSSEDKSENLVIPNAASWL